MKGSGECLGDINPVLIGCGNTGEFPGVFNLGGGLKLS